MFKKIVMGLLVLGMTSMFGMSIKELNSASKSDLMQIKGIGEAKADAIIKERKKGKFKSYDDLTRVKGVGQSIAKNVKNDVKADKSEKKSSDKKKK